MYPCAERRCAGAVSRRAAVTGVAAWLGWPGLAAASAPSDIHLVSDAWHGLTRQDGSGLYFDLIRAVYARRQIRVRISIYPYARAAQLVKEQRADAWVASFMNEKHFALYPRWHFDRNEQWVLYRKREGYRFEGTTDLRGKRVAWLRDFGLDKYISEPMKRVEVDTLRSGLQMLEAGRVDYLIAAQSDLLHEAQIGLIDLSGFEQAFLMHLHLYLAFADSARGALLRRIWDDEMALFHRSEDFRAIYARAGFPYPF